MLNVVLVYIAASVSKFKKEQPNLLQTLKRITQRQTCTLKPTHIEIQTWWHDRSI